MKLTGPHCCLPAGWSLTGPYSGPVAAVTALARTLALALVLALALALALALVLDLALALANCLPVCRCSQVTALARTLCTREYLPEQENVRIASSLQDIIPRISPCNSTPI